MSFKRIFILLSGLALGVVAQAQIITTFAGNGTYGYSGNGGPATSAQFAWQMGLAIDNAGNVYIADHDNNVIRVVNSAGIISTFAGNHSVGFSGDGGPASAAALYHPSWLTTDNFGNLYFIDQNNAVIRKVDPSGIITTLTNGSSGYSGDGGPLSAATFRTLTGITIDNAGNMYISDWGNNVIRKVNTSGIVSTIAGTGTAGFSGDGGPATAAQLNLPYQVKLDNAGNIYIPDNGNTRIRKINTAGIITTIAGTGGFGYSGDGGAATAATFRYPWALSLDNNDNIYITDAGTDVIRKINTAGIITTFAGNGTSGYSGDGGPATAAQLSDVCAAVADNAGNVYISQRTPFYVIRKVTNCLSAVITQQPTGATFCNTGNASFTVVTTNAATLQWQVNTGSGWTNLSDNAIYGGSSTDHLTVTGADPSMNGYQYRCAVTNTCATIFSTPTLLTVNTPTMPAINVTASATTICEGTNVVFTATISDAGANPVFQWKKNGITTGSNSSSFSDNGLANGDVISCVLTTTNTCATTNTATSNNVIMTVTSAVTPSATITATGNNICAGTAITFNATIVNGGTTPAYTWFKNGVNLFHNFPTYTNNTLNNGDFIMCAFMSSLSCVTTPLGVSNEIVVNVTPLATPAVTVTTSTPSICKGTLATFAAAATNGGASPAYQWRKNGNNVGANSNIYTDNSIATGDVIVCILTSNAGCLVTPTATSNSISPTVLNNPVVALDHTNTLCTSGTRQLDPGSYSSYLWDNGSTAQTRLVNALGTYYVEVTDNNGCKGSDTTKITSFLPLPSGFTPIDTAVCSYGSIDLKAQPGYVSYLWNNGSTGSMITVSVPAVYWLEVKDQFGCTAKESITVSPKECMKGFYIPTAFTPNGDGKNDVFRPLLFGNVRHYSFQVYNRWGNLVFQTTNPVNGWDGVYKGTRLETNAFVWVCSYQFDGEEKRVKRGTVVVIR
jgi:gliding motility-associated-like protein